MIEVASIVGTEVAAVVGTELAVSGGILTASVAGSWGTFGLSILAGVIVDCIISVLTDPTPQIEADLNKAPDENAAKMRAKFETIMNKAMELKHANTMGLRWKQLMAVLVIATGIFFAPAAQAGAVGTLLKGLGKATKEAAEKSPTVARLAKQYGDDAIVTLNRNPQRLEIVEQLGDDAAEELKSVNLQQITQPNADAPAANRSWLGTAPAPEKPPAAGCCARACPLPKTASPGIPPRSTGNFLAYQNIHS